MSVPHSSTPFSQADYLAANPLTCIFPLIGYDAVVHDCGEPAVTGTQGCWCATHGLMMEMWNLEQDRKETRPDYGMLDSERDACIADLVAYELVLVRAEIAGMA
jgi:hypothetical protein